MNRKATNRKHNQAKKEWFDAIKDVICPDCKNKYPTYVMEFDHVNGRKKETPTISALVSKLGRARLLEEIKKCDVVCANCHKTRTHFRRGGSHK